jgi:uncharacterized membrane protein
MTDADSSNIVSTVSEAKNQIISDFGLVLTVYILYLVGFVTGLTALIGVIIAQIQCSRADPISQTHFQFQIRTFWIGLAYILIGFLTLHIAVGGLVLLWWVIWTLIRCVKGMLAVNAGEPIRDPLSWGFG